ncbi:MAG: hypothetical protein Q4A04_08485 [Eubacteriales bacterium]|nr:hypothetical protein [Eubacteriales bacterium]
MSFLDLFRGRKSEEEKVPTPEEYKETRTYDYSTAENRVSTAEWLFEQARMERTAKESEWLKYDDYYNFAHDTSKNAAESLDEMEVPFIPATVPEPYIMVESQITPDVPMPEFHGRDEDDDEKSMERQLAVRYVMENNRINDMNTSNERRLRKYGDAFWKVYWDDKRMCGEKEGDLVIKDIGLEDIYPDPTSKTLGECEYVDYVYTMHKFAFWRMFHEAIQKQGYSLDDIMESEYRERDGLFDPYTEGSQALEDRVQVLEHWFRQPFDDPKGKFQSGDIACTIQAGGIELKYIPKYWEKTGKQNKLYPFVHYWCIRNENSFWNVSELAPIIGLVDSADKELANGLLNDTMMANDIIVVDENALADGEEITNQPGAMIRVKNGQINQAIKRLGGIGDGVRSVEMVNWLQNQMQRTNRNFDTNNGQESARITTASGLLQIRSDAAVQSELKKADRNKGFCRLYELIDWSCLEFFDDDRLLYIGADKKDGEATRIRYNTENFAAVLREAVMDPETNKVLSPEQKYFPRVDVTVTTGDGIARNPASTVQVLDRLAAVQVTEDNYQLLEAELEYLDIPQKQEIIDRWNKKFQSNIPQEVTEALQSDPQLLEAVMQMASQVRQLQGGAQQMGVSDIVAGDGIEVPTY